MANLLEDFTAELNRHIFLREFSFDRSRFKAACGHEYELADHIISMPQGTMLFQLKEREEAAPVDESAMNTWFRKKVLGKACGQLADSQRYLREERPLIVCNQRGHAQDLSGRTQNIVSIVLYATSAAPPNWVPLSHYLSTRAGFVHVLSAENYYHLCQTLAAPAELFDFFKFRQNLFLRLPASIWSEAQIAAQFILETQEEQNADVVRDVIRRTQQDNQTLGITRILSKFGEKVVGSSDARSTYEYYSVLVELAQLNRSQLREFGTLFNWAVNKAGGVDFEIPCRLHSPSSNIGFVFVSVPRDAYSLRLKALQNFAMAMKYEFRLDRQIGVCIARDGEMFQIDWVLIEARWQPDPDMEEALATRYPFRDRPAPRPTFRYQLSDGHESNACGKVQYGCGIKRNTP